jgi:hypothetical protein
VRRAREGGRGRGRRRQEAPSFELTRRFNGTHYRNTAGLGHTRVGLRSLARSALKPLNAAWKRNRGIPPSKRPFFSTFFQLNSDHFYLHNSHTLPARFRPVPRLGMSSASELSEEASVLRAVSARLLADVEKLRPPTAATDGFAVGGGATVTEAELVACKDALSAAKHRLIDLQTRKSLAAALASDRPFAALDSNAGAANVFLLVLLWRRRPLSVHAPARCMPTAAPHRPICSCGGGGVRERARGRARSEGSPRGGCRAHGASRAHARTRELASARPRP